MNGLRINIILSIGVLSLSLSSLINVAIAQSPKNCVMTEAEQESIFGDPPPLCPGAHEAEQIRRQAEQLKRDQDQEVKRQADQARQQAIQEQITKRRAELQNGDQIKSMSDCALKFGNMYNGDQFDVGIDPDNTNRKIIGTLDDYDSGRGFIERAGDRQTSLSAAYFSTNGNTTWLQKSDVKIGGAVVVFGTYRKNDEAVFMTGNAKKGRKVIHVVALCVAPAGIGDVVFQKMLGQ